MKKKFILWFLVFPLLVFSQEWKLKKDKNNIKVYTRKLDSREIHEYKATMVVNTSIEKALKAITDGNNLWKWNYKTPKSKTIKKMGVDEYVFWMKNDLPWPIKNRDAVTDVSVFYLKNGGIKITLRPNHSQKVALEKNTIRITDFKGHWLLIPKENSLKITQQVYGDPKGNLPNWILNSMLTKAPYYTFLNLKKLLEN